MPRLVVRIGRGRGRLPVVASQVLADGAAVGREVAPRREVDAIETEPVVGDAAAWERGARRGHAPRFMVPRRPVGAVPGAAAGDDLAQASFPGAGVGGQQMDAIEEAHAAAGDRHGALADLGGRRRLRRRTRTPAPCGGSARRGSPSTSRGRSRRSRPRSNPTRPDRSSRSRARAARRTRLHRSHAGSPSRFPSGRHDFTGSRADQCGSSTIQRRGHPPRTAEVDAGTDPGAHRRAAAAQLSSSGFGLSFALSFAGLSLPCSRSSLGRPSPSRRRS